MPRLIFPCSLKSVFAFLFLHITIFLKECCFTGLCPKEWTWSKYSDTCVKLFEKNLSWSSAKDTCVSHKADLVAINSVERNKFIFDILLNFLGSTEKHVWIGVSNITTWPDSRKKKKQRKSHCVQINKKTKTAFELWPIPCDHKALFICEREQVNPIKEKAESSGSPGWIFGVFGFFLGVFTYSVLFCFVVFRLGVEDNKNEKNTNKARSNSASETEGMSGARTAGFQVGEEAETLGMEQRSVSAQFEPEPRRMEYTFRQIARNIMKRQSDEKKTFALNYKKKMSKAERAASRESIV